MEQHGQRDLFRHQILGVGAGEGESCAGSLPARLTSIHGLSGRDGACYFSRAEGLGAKGEEGVGLGSGFAAQDSLGVQKEGDFGEDK